MIGRGATDTKKLNFYKMLGFKKNHLAIILFYESDLAFCECFSNCWVSHWRHWWKPLVVIEQHILSDEQLQKEYFGLVGDYSICLFKCSANSKRTSSH